MLQRIVQDCQRIADAWAYSYAHRSEEAAGYAADSAVLGVQAVRLQLDMTYDSPTVLRGSEYDAFVVAARRLLDLVPSGLPTQGAVEAAPARLSALRAALEAYYVANPERRPDQNPEDRTNDT